MRQRVADEVGMHLHYALIEDPTYAEAYAEELARVLADLHGALDPTELRVLAPPLRDDVYPLTAPVLRVVVPSLPVHSEQPRGRPCDGSRAPFLDIFVSITLARKQRSRRTLAGQRDGRRLREAA